MPRLIPLILILMVAGCAGKSSSGSAPEASEFRFVDRNDVMLSTFNQPVSGEAREKTFQGRGVKGWFREGGSWQVEGPVRHPGLLCGTYQMGVQLGHGGQGCALARWTTPIEYADSRMQCNGATVIHAGGGRALAFGEALAESNCVRVVVRCSGRC